jgi:hypothetical protein
MKERKLKLLVFCIVVGCFITAGPALGNPTFTVESYTQWEQLLVPEGPNEPAIGPVELSEWSEYVGHWDTYLEEGPGFPNDTEYCPPQLYVYEGNDSDPCYPDNPGLVMAWGAPDQNVPDVNYSSAWKYVYGEDPDLRNCTITLKVFPPAGMVYVSFGLRDTSNRTISWSWNTPSTIPYATFTTIKINTNNIGLGTAAAVPTADSFAPNPNFDLSKVASFIINETWHSQPGVFTAPPPGGSGNFYWNAWRSYSVTTNTGGGPGPGPGVPDAKLKWYLKWSQQPVAIDPNEEPPIFIGWDEVSDHNHPPDPIVADDWKCEDDRPVTDVHWWGSFLGWNQPHVPPLLPKAFHIGIWNDIPDPNPGDPSVFSHPNEMVWENYCDNWVWNFAGFDESPRDPNERDSCFQFTQLLSEDEWFYQEPNDPNDPNDPNASATVYWLSIAAIYDHNDHNDPNFYPWGWKTREHFFNDDAVRITNTNNPTSGTAWPPTPPTVGSLWVLGNPIFWPDPCDTWDMAFELTTNQPAYVDDPIPGDLNADRIVNLIDLDIMAGNWLETWP